MKRFHVHVAVSDLPTNIRFYTQFFGVPPTIEKSDYAKWLMEDPRINFAISSRGSAPGINHLGIQAEHPEELEVLQQRAQAAAPEHGLEQTSATCCYAVSDKYWTVDPQGIAWEQFHTTGEVTQFGKDRATSKGACCIPLQPQAN